MSTLLIHPSSIRTKRARILPIIRASSGGAFARVLSPQKDICELHTVLDDVISKCARRFANKFVMMSFNGPVFVRVSESIVERVMGLIFDGMRSAGLWSDGECECISPTIGYVSGGYCAALELKDEKASLSPALLRHFANGNSICPCNLPGRQLLMARDLVQKHGGRLWLRSNSPAEKPGMILRLYFAVGPMLPQ